MTNLPPSNLPFLKKAYCDIIVDERDTDQTGKQSSPIAQRKSFTFTDGSYISITEIFKSGKLDYYHYDWFSKNKKLLMKFHSEEHTDKAYQTSTEPFHIHVQGIMDEKRLPNPSFQDLNSVLQFIRCCLLVINNYNK